MNIKSTVPSQYRHHRTQLEGACVGAALLESSVAGLMQTKDTKEERKCLAGRTLQLCLPERFQSEMGTLAAKVLLVLAQWRKTICPSPGEWARKHSGYKRWEAKLH